MARLTPREWTPIYGVAALSSRMGSMKRFLLAAVYDMFLSALALTIAILVLAIGILGRDAVRRMEVQKVYAQTQIVHPNPDCQFFVSITTAGSVAPSTPFDNRQQGCNTWSFVYFSSGFSAVSVALETAANNNGVAGSFSTGFPVQQSVIAGSNPASDTTGGYLWVKGINAWVRVKLTSATGTGVINGALFGWRIPNAAGQ